jgi:hypothetical protein
MISLGEMGRDATFLRRSKLDRARISLPFAKIRILFVENALSLFQKTRVQTDSPRFHSHLFGVCRGRVHIGVLSIRLVLQSFCRPRTPGKKHAVTVNTVCFYLSPVAFSSKIHRHLSLRIGLEFEKQGGYAQFKVL